MKCSTLGNIIGQSGRDAVTMVLPALRRDLMLDLVVVNAENASHGFGLAPDMARTLFAVGADVLTLGNHAWDRKEIIPYIEEEPQLICRLNYARACCIQSNSETAVKHLKKQIKNLKI